MRVGLGGAALACALLAMAGCAQKPVAPAAAPLTDVDGGDLEPPSLQAPNGRCCVLPTDAGVSASDECTVAAQGIGRPDASASGLAEPCWDSNAAGSYALWTCGAVGADASVKCGDNGLTCDLGAACRLQDVSNAKGGCWGTVQPCYYPWP